MPALSAGTQTFSVKFNTSGGTRTVTATDISDGTKTANVSAAITVNVGAFAAQRGVAAMGAYCAAKSSVVRLTESMAAELREKHINVNCVLPTIMDTPENRAAMPDADPARWVAPKDLANVIVFLASPAARAIHGVALPVTGLS